MGMLNFFGPTQGVVNRHHLVSFRTHRAAVPISTIFKTTQAVITFNEDVTGGDLIGFTATVNVLPNVVVSAIRTAFAEITVTWTTAGALTNPVIIDYAPGAWVSVVGGDLVKSFSVNGVIT